MQVPNKEQVKALSEDLRSRSKVPGVWSNNIVGSFNPS